MKMLKHISIFGFHKICEKKLKLVLENMKILGAPKIRCLETRHSDWEYLAIEGSHQLEAARILGLTPEFEFLDPASEIDLNTIDLNDMKEWGGLKKSLKGLTEITGHQFLEKIGNLSYHGHGYSDGHMVGYSFDEGHFSEGEYYVQNIKNNNKINITTFAFKQKDEREDFLAKYVEAMKIAGIPKIRLLEIDNGWQAIEGENLLYAANKLGITPEFEFLDPASEIDIETIDTYPCEEWEDCDFKTGHEFLQLLNDISYVRDKYFFKVDLLENRPCRTSEEMKKIVREKVEGAIKIEHVVKREESLMQVDKDLLKKEIKFGSNPTAKIEKSRKWDQLLNSIQRTKELLKEMQGMEDPIRPPMEIEWHRGWENNKEIKNQYQIHSLVNELAYDIEKRTDKYYHEAWLETAEAKDLTNESVNTDDSVDEDSEDDSNVVYFNKP